MEKERGAFLRRSSRLIFGRSILLFLALGLNFFWVFSMLFDLFQMVPMMVGGTVVFTAFMLLYVLNAQMEPTVKLSWCVLIGILPLFGAILFFFVKLDLGHRMEAKAISRSLEQSKSFRARSEGLQQAVCQTDPELFGLIHYLDSVGADVYAGTGVEYFPLGEDLFAAMLRELERAENFIFLEYFAIAPGHTWNSILEVLARKAAQGVEVRVLYDGGSSLFDLPWNYPKKLEALGIRCKVFSPYRPFVSTHYNNRDHRKIMVIDGKAAFTGGVNLLDRYINQGSPFGHWKDTGVLLTGDGARGFTLLFLQMWNATQRTSEYAAYLQTPQHTAPEQGLVIPYGDSPLDRERVGETVYRHILDHARSYVYIMTPYLILDQELETSLCYAARRGVDVRLILPHIPDKKYAFLLAKSHYRTLIQAGVKIYEYTPGFVHAKVFLCDDREAVVGTINLDYRSLYLHFECAAYLYKVPALEDIARDFRETLEKSQPITEADTKNQSLLSRLCGAVLKAFAPLM